MGMDDKDSCESRAVVEPSSAKQSRLHWQRYEVFTQVLSRLRELNLDDVKSPGFEDQLWLHFSRLPARYASDVNVERAEDVLMHKRLLSSAEDPENRPAFEVRPVQVHPNYNGASADLVDVSSSLKDEAQSFHPPPTFGLSPNLQTLELNDNKTHANDGDSESNLPSRIYRPMHEVTFSTIDKPKVLSQLTSILSEIGLNIEEAHVFSTTDGFSLDVFVVDGWPYEKTELLRSEIQKEIFKTKEQPELILTPKYEQNQTVPEPNSECVKIPTDGTDDWEIDSQLLKFENKIASGTFGDLYKGTYCSQEVAIKVLKPENLNADMLKEFNQEVYIMRKIRHRNVIQFIGARTRPPNMCIVTEFMSRGSVYNFLHKLRGAFKLPNLLKVATDVSKGMYYLHQNNIIHRDLKTAIENYSHWEVVGPLPSYGRSIEVPGGRYRSLITGSNVTDVVITGNNGTIDGQGAVWWEQFDQHALNYSRPHLVEFIGSSHVVISNLTFLNAPAWNIRPAYCSNVLVQNITVHSPSKSPYTNGIVPDSSNHVCIENSNISMGQDAIALKSGWDEYGIAYGEPTENVHIRDVRLQSTEGAGVAFGSEMSGGISNVLVENLFIYESLVGIELKTARGRGGYIQGVILSGVEMENVSVGIKATGYVDTHPDDNFDPNAYPVVSNITFKDVVGTNISTAGNFTGLPESPFTSICLSDIYFSISPDTSTPQWICYAVSGVSSNVSPEPCSELQNPISGTYSTTCTSLLRPFAQVAIL